MMKSISILLILLCVITSGYAQVTLSADKKGKADFPLVTRSQKAVVCYDKTDFEVVKKVVSLFVEDVERVTGKQIQTYASVPSRAEAIIVVGTLGKSKQIDRLAASGKIDVSSIRGGWEQYLVNLVESPFPGIGKALVIAGSDRRGTAYGLFSVSEAIGVSPWYWWADAPVAKRKELNLHVNRYVSHQPTVKYRGIFINDEDWGLLRWAKHTFEKDRGNIGPKTYAKVCELLLRLKGNYLCPAMHEASTAFNKIPENKLVADSFAIVMGSSHCEPLLFNTASEWDKKSMGEWNYDTNKEGINKALKQRVVENSPYENVYTLALRGLHDKAMSGSSDMRERAVTLGKALADQRRILTDVTGTPGNEIPQAFTPYKEVLDVYNEGLELPDDVTIIWSDDNYGYMKRLSSAREQKRSGRAGVYYHASYLGKPHDNLWMNTTPPALMYEELRKAYDTTADRIWLLNAGDIKSCEFAVTLFLAMAYDIDSFNYDNISTYQAHWLCGMFGNQYYDDFLDITDTFFHLAFSRKPEFMGWGYQWSSDKHGKERNTDTDFSFTNYREAETRLTEYQRIGKAVERILQKLPEEQKAGFYQLLYYPVKGCELLNRMVLNGQKNRWYALQKRAATNKLGEEARLCYDSLQVITDGYNSLSDGKWNHVMTTRQGFAASYFELPKLETLSLSTLPSLRVLAEGEDIVAGMKSFHSLPAFNTYLRKSYYVDVYNRGGGILKWSASSSDEWIVIDKTGGRTATEERMVVSVDWNKVPVGDRVLGNIEISATGGQKEVIYVSVFNPASPSVDGMDTLFIEDNGVVSIPAAGFHRKVENKDIQIQLIPNLGFENVSVQLGNPVAPVQRTASVDVPRVEYDFYTFRQGSVDVYTYVLPTFTLSADRSYAGHEATNVETRYGVCIDEGPVMNPSTSSFEYAQIWYESALKNCRINKTTLHIDKPGKHTLKILCGDAGTVLQKVVLDFGGMKRSYLGPQPTKGNAQR